MLECPACLKLVFPAPQCPACGAPLAGERPQRLGPKSPREREAILEEAVREALARGYWVEAEEENGVVLFKGFPGERVRLRVDELGNIHTEDL